MVDYCFFLKTLSLGINVIHWILLKKGNTYFNIKKYSVNINTCMLKNAIFEGKFNNGNNLSSKQSFCYLLRLLSFSPHIWWACSAPVIPLLGQLRNAPASTFMPECGWSDSNLSAIGRQKCIRKQRFGPIPLSKMISLN